MMSAEWKWSLNAAIEASIRQGGLVARAGEVEVEVDEVDGPGYWARIPLGFSSAEGVVLEPFVLEGGPGGWMQAWADGSTLTVASGHAGLQVALEFVRSFLGVPDTAGWGSGEAVPDGASQAD